MHEQTLTRSFPRAYASMNTVSAEKSSLQTIASQSDHLTKAPTDVQDRKYVHAILLYDGEPGEQGHKP